MDHSANTKSNQLRRNFIQAGCSSEQFSGLLPFASYARALGIPQCKENLDANPISLNTARDTHIGFTIWCAGGVHTHAILKNENVSDCTSKTNQLRDQPSKLKQTSFRDARKATGRPNVSEECHSDSQMDSLGTSRGLGDKDNTALQPYSDALRSAELQKLVQLRLADHWHNAQMKKTCGLFAVLWSPLWRTIQNALQSRQWCLKVLLKIAPRIVFTLLAYCTGQTLSMSA
jgi:hypothetical protein